MSLILDTLYPQLCYGCGVSGSHLCPSCHSALLTREITHPKHSLLDGNLSVFRYTGTIRQMIEDFKFNFVFSLAPTFSDLFFHHLTADFPHLVNYWQENHFTIVPIPLFSERQNWRGFNQSVLVGELLAAKLQLNFIPDLLIRHSASVPQSTIKDKRLRRQNTKNIFSLNHSTVEAPLAGAQQNFILLDDVYTTGSTINSACKTIKENYYKNISAGVGGLTLWSLTIAG